MSTMNVNGYEIKAYANLRYTNLRYTNLKGANLNLRDAYLIGADLRDAYLIGAHLRGANLEGANLRGAYLRGAYLRGANLEGANLPHFLIVPECGSFYAFKKTTKGVIKIQIPAKAKRTNSLTNRKCRAEFIKVISGAGIGGTGPIYKSLTYNKGDVITADSYDDDIRLECTNGIHFFMTVKEAEEW